MDEIRHSQVKGDLRRTPEWQIGLVIQDVFKKGVSSPSAINRVPQGVRDALQARLGESLSPLRVLEQYVDALSDCC